MVSAADTTSAIALMPQQPNLWSPSSKVILTRLRFGSQADHTHVIKTFIILLNMT